jgi:hypothetical protein
METFPFDCADSKPKELAIVYAMLADGTTQKAVWTGSRWWSVEGEIEPVRWRRHEDKSNKHLQETSGVEQSNS